MTGEEAKARGYRRTSNKHRMVSRIDRADWIAVLARHLNRAPADLYEPGATKVAGNWCDHYRRCLSRDTLTLSEAEFRKVPGSDWDDTGYVPLPGDTVVSPDASIIAGMRQAFLDFEEEMGESMERSLSDEALLILASHIRRRVPFTA